MSTATPVRLQRSRAKGARLVSPNGLPVVCVTRGTKWGNPFRVFGQNEYLYCDASHRRKILTPWVIFDHEQDIRREPATARMAVDYFHRWAMGLLDPEAKVVRPRPFTLDDIRRELAGKNLACWCCAFEPCHASVLLELAYASPAASLALGHLAASPAPGEKGGRE